MRQSKTASTPFLLTLVVMTGACNLFDLWYTTRALAAVETAHELNPVFRALLSAPALAAGYKLIVIPLLLLVLYRRRERRAARFGVYLCATFYIANTVIQLLTMYHWWE